MNGGLERKGVEKRDPSGRLIPGNGKGRGAHPLKTTKDAAPPLGVQGSPTRQRMRHLLYVAKGCPPAYLCFALRGVQRSST